MVGRGGQIYLLAKYHTCLITEKERSKKYTSFFNETLRGEGLETDYEKFHSLLTNNELHCVLLCTIF